MSKVRKSSPVVVRPSEPATIKSGSTIKLSHLDQGNFPYVVLLAFEHAINDAANTMKGALSQALVHYYPFCGRVVSGANCTDIECTGEGAVEFIAATADCSLKEAPELLGKSSCRVEGGGGGRSSLLDELAVYYPIGSYGPDDPLLSMQVTEFTCGGFVLGVTWSHVIADGVGIAQFIRAVSEFARALPSSPSVAPIRCDAAVSSHPPGMRPWKEAIRSLPREPMPQLVFLDLTIPWSFIDRVKAGFPGSTTFEVVLAVLWQCRTRAIMSGSGGSSRPDSLSLVTFWVNMLKHVGAMDGFYGNCSIDSLVVAASGTVVSADIMDLVNMIKDAKHQVPDEINESKKKKKELAEEDNVPQHQQQPEEKTKDDDKRSKNHELLLQGLDGKYSLFSVSSWRNIGFEEVDFGSGQPATVRCHALPPVPMCIVCLRCKGIDGANVLSNCVKEEHADAFLEEIAKLTT